MRSPIKAINQSVFRSSSHDRHRRGRQRFEPHIAQQTPTTHTPLLNDDYNVKVLSGVMGRQLTSLGTTVRAWRCVVLLCLLASLAARSRGTVTCPPACTCSAESVQCENSKNITEVPEVLPFNDTLQSLLIARTAIQHINVSAFRHLQHLRTLDLNNNNIDTLANDGVFQGLALLESLVLRRNFLKEFSGETFAGLENLKVLELSWNRFVELDNNWFQYLRKLEVLDLARNDIEHIQEQAFVGLGNLKVLNLTRNKLITMSGSYFGPLTSLESLIVDDNAIKLIEDESFSALVSLKQLSLTGNRDLRTVQPRAFGSRSGSFPLERLSLKGTRLAEVPVEILRILTNLKNLDMSQTAITAIKTASFSRLTALLNLTIDSVPGLALIEAGAFSALGSLETLVITNNRMLINLTAGVFKSLSSLRYLDLHNNGLQTLSSDLADWHQIAIVDLRGNPLHCDCHAVWILTLKTASGYNASTPPDKLTASTAGGDSNPGDDVCSNDSVPSKQRQAEISTAAFVRQIACHMPARLHGKCLTSLPVEDFRCPSPEEPRKKDSNDRRFQTGIVAASVTCLVLLCCALFLKFRRRVCSVCRRQYRYKTHRNQGVNGGSPTTQIVELETTQLEDFDSDQDFSLQP